MWNKEDDEDDAPTAEEIEDKLKELATWYDQQEDLPPRKDKKIRRFLVGCKYRLETAKKKIKKYHEIRTATPEWFADRDPTDTKIKDLVEVGVAMPLIKKDENGCVSLLCRSVCLPANTHPMYLIYKAGYLCLDLLLDLDEDVSAKGLNILVDCEGVSFGHILQITPRMLYKTIQLYQECFPIRIKSMHLFNVPTILNTVVTLFRGLMGAKLRSRFHNHGMDLAHFHFKFDKRLLPQEYGGDDASLKEVQIPAWSQKLMDNRQRILDGDL